MTELKQRILPSVQKPARYTGGEWGEIKKDLGSTRVRVAFCFPDTYEIGMSNVGMRILYGVMNEMDGVWCERVFAPDADMEAIMRREFGDLKTPLYNVAHPLAESGKPIFIPFGELDNYQSNAKKMDEAYAALESGEDFYQSALAFGRFQQMLSEFPAETLS